METIVKRRPITNFFNFQDFVTIACVVALFVFAFFAKSYYVAIACSLVFWILIFALPLEKGYSLWFLSYPLSGIFDDCGFLYLFNISCLVLLFKLLLYIFYFRFSIQTQSIVAMVLVLFLALLDLVNAAHFNVLSASYLSNMTVWTSFVLLLLSPYAFERINLKLIFLYTIVGFSLSCILCYISIIDKWGSISNIPIAYRFIGLLRDPNYFSLFGIIIAFSSLKIIDGGKKYLFFFVLLALSLLSISKMAFLLSVGGIVLCIISFLVSRDKKKNSRFHIGGIAFGIAIIMALLIIAFATGAISWFVEKMSFRLDNYSLTTGRDVLQMNYLECLFSDYRVTFFGSSLNYNYVFNISYAGYENMVSHNTYIDLLLSFGFVGTVIFIVIIILGFSSYYSHRNVKCIKNSFDDFIVPIIFFTSFIALSYLKADGFYLLLFFVGVLFCYKKKALE